MSRHYKNRQPEMPALLRYQGSAGARPCQGRSSLDRACAPAEYGSYRKARIGKISQIGVSTLSGEPRPVRARAVRDRRPHMRGLHREIASRDAPVVCIQVAKPKPALSRVTKEVTIATASGGRQRTLTGDRSQVRHDVALALGTATWLRDEEDALGVGDLPHTVWPGRTVRAGSRCCRRRG